MDDQEKSKNAGGAFEDIGRTLDRELKKLVDFVNDRVVPTARQDSEKLLRNAASVLEQLADKLAKDRANQPPRQEPPGTTNV